MATNNDYDIKANPNLVIALGAYIRSKRIQKNIGLREMSEMLNISPAYLSNLESGKHSMMNPLLLKNIARILELDHLTLYKIVGYTDKNRKEIKEEILKEFLEEFSESEKTDLIKKIISMSLEQINILKKYIDIISKIQTWKEEK